MKTNKLIAAALLPLLFSCAKENIAPAETPENADDYITVNLVPGADTVTKASFDDNDGIIWQKGGFAGIVNAAGDNIKSKELDNIYNWNGNNQASFKFLKTELAGKSGPYVLYYPHHDEVSGSDGKYTIPIFVSVTQTSDIGKSTEIFSVVSKKAFELVPYKEEDKDTDYDNNGADVEFKVVGSYIRILPYGGTKEGEILDYIKIYDINEVNKVSGRYFVSVAVNNDNTTTISKTDASDLLSNEIYVNFDSKPKIKIDKKDAKGIYAQVRSGKHQLAYELHTKVGDMDCTYTFKSSKETDFAFGSIKDIPLNITKATETTVSSPEKLYIVGDGSSVGWNLSNAIEMSKNGHIFTTNVYLNTQVRNGNAYQNAEGFKFILQNDSFDPAYVNGGDNTLKKLTDGVADNKFTVDKAGYYTVTADFSTGKVTCTPAAPDKFYIWGDATDAGWDSAEAIKLDQDQNDKFVFTKKDISLKKGDYKFFSVDSETTAYVNDGNGNLVFFDSPSGTEADRKFKVDEDGIYTLTVNLDKNSVTWSKKTPQVRHWNWEKTTTMFPTGVEGEYKAEGVIIGGNDPGYHDFKVTLGDKYYHLATTDGEISTFSKDSDYTYTCDVVLDSNSDLVWWINAQNTQNERFYDIILDTKKNQLRVRFSQGTSFWLNGDSFVWGEKNDDYKSTDSDGDGIVTWDVTISKEKFNFRICGEYTYPFSNQFYCGEWYYATGDKIELKDGNECEVLPFVSDYNNSNWKIGEAGDYKITFDYKNLKIKVEKRLQ